MATSLEARFKRFLVSLPGSEEIDSMDIPQDSERRRKADFLLEGRKVIVELKTLVVDTSHKVNAGIEKHREREDFPVFYGAMDAHKVLSHLPDGELINRKMYGAITRSVEDAVRSAEEQISHTRHVLRLYDSVGVLVILNESIDILSPEVVGHRVSTVMRRARTGRSAVELLDFAWLFFESHSVGNPVNLTNFPSMLVKGNRSQEFSWFPSYHNDLVARWASFNGGIAFDGSDVGERLNYTSSKRFNPSPEAPLKRHELWRRQYDANPYLRHLQDSEVLALGSDLIHQLEPYFVQGGLGFVEQAVMPLMEKFTCFLQEANFRGLDMRDIPKP